MPAVAVIPRRCSLSRHLSSPLSPPHRVSPSPSPAPLSGRRRRARCRSGAGGRQRHAPAVPGRCRCCICHHGPYHGSLAESYLPVAQPVLNLHAVSNPKSRPGRAQQRRGVDADGSAFPVGDVFVAGPLGPAGPGVGRKRYGLGAVGAGRPAFAVGVMVAMGPQAPAAWRAQSGDHGLARPRRSLRRPGHATAGGPGCLGRPIRRVVVSGDTSAGTGEISGLQCIDHDDQVLREGRQEGRTGNAVSEAAFDAGALRCSIDDTASPLAVPFTGLRSGGRRDGFRKRARIAGFPDPDPVDYPFVGILEGNGIQDCSSMRGGSTRCTIFSVLNRSLTSMPSGISRPSALSTRAGSASTFALKSGSS